jgi:D-3-phosphoglycerate dehydrogenase
MERAMAGSSLGVTKIEKLFWGTQDKDLFTKRQINIERNGPDAESYAEGLDEAIEDAEILMVHFCPVPGKLIEKAKRLKIILTSRGGLENIDLKSASEHNIPVVNVIRNAEPVADFALGMILDITRNITSSCRRLFEKGEWAKTFLNSPYVTTLNSLTIGFVGLGNVGIALATRLHALGVSIIGFDDYVSRERLEKNGLGTIEMVGTMNEVFERADVITLHLRLTDENVGCIDKSCFGRMKESAYFLNTARGGLVNEEDLIDALESRSIAGAALDVFKMEPLPADSRLLKLDNVLLTSHIAGTTVDAIPMSPFMLISAVEKIVQNGLTERIVNYSDIKGALNEQ